MYIFHQQSADICMYVYFVYIKRAKSRSSLFVDFRMCSVFVCACVCVRERERENV